MKFKVEENAELDKQSPLLKKIISAINLKSRNSFNNIKCINLFVDKSSNIEHFSKTLSRVASSVQHKPLFTRDNKYENIRICSPNKQTKVNLPSLPSLNVFTFKQNTISNTLNHLYTNRSVTNFKNSNCVTANLTPKRKYSELEDDLFEDLVEKPFLSYNHSKNISKRPSVEKLDLHKMETKNLCSDGKLKNELKKKSSLLSRSISPYCAKSNISEKLRLTLPIISML